MSGEGCFFVKIKQSPLSRLGESVELRFQITQHMLRSYGVMSN
ncbi:MAG: hypothetical protein J6S85_08300 [Methanobrevibacter sp.]|nr:hypothetical protein [Methanobrevibacter sp.]